MRRYADLNLATIGVKRIKRLQMRWVAPARRRQTYLYHDLQTDLAASRPYLADFAESFLAAVERIHPIDAVMAANVDYWQDEALKLACRRRATPFLVLSRESYGIGHARDYVDKLYREAAFRFEGDGLALASATCVDFMRQTGAIATDLIVATGWPRYDAWSEIDLPPLDRRPIVTLMAYGDPRAVQYAAGNFRDVFQAFVAAARRHSRKLRFVVKLKKPNEGGYLADICSDFQAAGIEMTADAPLPQLVAQSRAVIGFNTLAVLEALLGDTAVIVPLWGDAERGAHRSLLHADRPEDSAVCYFPRSREAFGNLLEAVAGNELPALGTRAERLARFSRHSAVDAETTASQRVRSFVTEALRNRNRA